jgi:predicted dehydrogenase
MKRQTNRRTFIKTTALAGTGFWVAGNAESASAAKRVSANEKLNLAFIGAGGRGGSHVNAALEANENIVALCDVDDERAKGSYEKCPSATKYKDFRKMLDKEHKNIDAVFVATPDHVHAFAALAAMRLGKHCYCEKPLTRLVREARAMTEAAEKYKVVTQMGNQGHSNRGARKGVEQIWAGAIGQVREAHAWTNRPVWPQPLLRPTDTPPIPSTLDWDLWLGPAPKRPYHPAYAPFSWRAWWDFGTGALGDMACHVMDLINWSLKLTHPTSAVASASEPPSAYPETGPKASTITWEFPARGDMAPVKVSWHDGGRKPNPELVGLKELPSNGSILVGDKGTMYVPHTYCDKTILLPKEEFKDYKAERVLPRVKSHHQEFFDACKGKGETLSNFAYAGPMTETALVGVAALRSGKRVEWDWKNMKVTNHSEINEIVHPEYRKGWTL